ncbi:centrosomal protein [Lasius niger]|uniref:Centrosomal protein n=1 Tax=Lasius niger TaxID=67767 RepID=A0A0J7KNJ4_LASNI|nr:centrosomal protein [Lasius niger]
MIEAVESDVQIILSIKEETDKIEPNSNPQYATDLIWETNKTALRKMRSGQATLKLECFAFKENKAKERIGYVLLSIRSAHIISKHGDLSPKANWHKLLGLRNDLKVQKPELLLTLRVENRKSADSNSMVEPECQYKLSLYDTDQCKLGEVDIVLKLENRGPHFILKKGTIGKNLGPPILDDSLAYKIVDELETWKERQKEMFKAELKRKEERHLDMLSEEWRKQRENLESKLACSVEQCKILANSLNNATEDLRIRRLKSLENETRLIKANEDLQWRYETKLQELKDSLDVMQNDLTSKITKLEEKKTALEAQVEILLYENETLKSSTSKQADELQMYQKASLTKDQTASLLQELKILEEKLDSAQKGKSFFKEQWGKAVREIHKMKVDHQQAMQVQIKNSKEELKNVDLAEILSVDTRALNNDQILLKELQKEIDVIKPKQSFASKEDYNRIFTIADDVYSKISCNGNKIGSDKSEEYNDRLKALREERDSLLKTGSYAADDIVIKKLNTEIRSLLVNR